MLFKIHPGNEVQCFVFFLDLTIQIKDDASPLQRVKTLLGPLYCQLHALCSTCHISEHEKYFDYQKKKHSWTAQMCCFLEIYELFWGINHVRQLALDDKYRCENGHTKKKYGVLFTLAFKCMKNKRPFLTGCLPKDWWQARAPIARPSPGSCTPWHFYFSLWLPGLNAKLCLVRPKNVAAQYCLM